MQRTMLKSRIHRATVTDSDLHCDVENGARFETYAIADGLDNYSPRVVHVDGRNEILNIDREVETLFRAPTAA